VTVAGQVVADSAGFPRVIQWLGEPAIETMIAAAACMMLGCSMRCGVLGSGRA
jgi:hypothetical protein